MFRKQQTTENNFLLRNEKVIMTIMCSALMICPYAICLWASIRKGSDEIAFIIAIMSLITSCLFEIFELCKSFRKKENKQGNKKNFLFDILTFPFVICFVVLMIFCIDYSFFGIIVNETVTNFISALVPFCYIISVTVRGVRECKSK